MIQATRDAMTDQRLEPIFIVGVGRSGTTLLVNLLGHHPRLAPIYETPFLRKVLRHCGRTSAFWRQRRLSGYGAVVSDWAARAYFAGRCRGVRKSIVSTLDGLAAPASIKQAYETFPFGLAHCIMFTAEELDRETASWMEILRAAPLSDDEILRVTRAYVDRLFALHCDRLNKPAWVNKTPALLNYLDRVSGLYPSAKFIHILRDGRDCAASVISLPWGPQNIAHAARHWKAHLLNGRRKVDRDKQNYLELRYEDLIASPREVMGRAFDFIGLTADLDAIVSAMTLYKTSVQSWKSVFSPEDRRVFAREAGDLLIDLGYEMDEKWID